MIWPSKGCSTDCHSVWWSGPAKAVLLVSSQALTVSCAVIVKLIIITRISRNCAVSLHSSPHMAWNCHCTGSQWPVFQKELKSFLFFMYTVVVVLGGSVCVCVCESMCVWVHLGVYVCVSPCVCGCRCVCMHVWVRESERNYPANLLFLNVHID